MATGNSNGRVFQWVIGVLLIGVLSVVAVLLNSGITLNATRLNDAFEAIKECRQHLADADKHFSMADQELYYKVEEIWTVIELEFPRSAHRAAAKVDSIRSKHGNNRESHEP